MLCRCSVCVDPTRSPPCVDYKSWRWEGHWGGDAKGESGIGFRKREGEKRQTTDGVRPAPFLDTMLRGLERRTVGSE